MISQSTVLAAYAVLLQGLGAVMRRELRARDHRPDLLLRLTDVGDD